MLTAMPICRFDLEIQNANSRLRRAQNTGIHPLQKMLQFSTTCNPDPYLSKKKRIGKTINKDASNLCCKQT